MARTLLCSVTWLFFGFLASLPDELNADDEFGWSVYAYKPIEWDPDRGRPYPTLIGLGSFGHGIGMRVDHTVHRQNCAGWVAEFTPFAHPNLLLRIHDSRRSFLAYVSQ